MYEAAKRELRMCFTCVLRVPVHVFCSLEVTFSPSSHTSDIALPTGSITYRYLVLVPLPLPYHQHYNDLRGFQALETFEETLAGTDHKEVETTHVAFLTNMRNEQPP
jgi:hypothetical protein